MTRLRICSDGPLLLADGRRAVLEEYYPEWEGGWQPIPIVEVTDERVD